MPQRSRIRLLTVAGALLLPLSGVAQETYPSRAITIVVGFPPGGSTDVVARLVAKHLAARLSQPVIVENRPGALGAIADQYVNRRPADGYTLYQVATPFSTGPVTNPSVHKLNPVVDFTPIARTATVLSILAVREDLPVNNLAELLAYAKAHPGKINVATTGIGSSDHLVPLRLEKLAGVTFNFVHYKGSVQGVQDMLSGHVDMKFDSYSSVRAFIEDKRLKGLALGTEERSPTAPGVPTMSETITGFFARSYTGLVGPPNMPAPIVEKLNGEVNAIMSIGEVREALAKLGLDAVTGTPQDFATYLREHGEFQREIVRTTGVKVE